MVAYSFQPMFVGAIEAKTKQHTIRGARKRHARPGEIIQLFCQQRSRHGFRIGQALCVDLIEICLTFNGDPEHEGVFTKPAAVMGLHEFARRDGFDSWDQLKWFWRQHHPECFSSYEVGEFQGVMIRWKDFTRGASA